MASFSQNSDVEDMDVVHEDNSTVLSRLQDAIIQIVQAVMSAKKGEPIELSWALETPDDEEEDDVCYTVVFGAPGTKGWPASHPFPDFG